MVLSAVIKLIMTTRTTLLEEMGAFHIQRVVPNKAIFTSGYIQLVEKHLPKACAMKLGRKFPPVMISSHPFISEVSLLGVS